MKEINKTSHVEKTPESNTGTINQLIEEKVATIVAAIWGSVYGQKQFTPEKDFEVTDLLRKLIKDDLTQVATHKEQEVLGKAIKIVRDSVIAVRSGDYRYGEGYDNARRDIELQLQALTTKEK